MKLKEIAEIKTGYFVNRNEKKDIGDFLYLTASNISDDNLINLKYKLYVDNSDKINKYIIQQEDIIMVIVGFKIANIILYKDKNNNIIIGSSLIIIRSKDKNLFNKLIQKKETIKSLAKGKVLSRIYIKDILELEI